MTCGGFPHSGTSGPYSVSLKQSTAHVTNIHMAHSTVTLNSKWPNNNEGENRQKKVVPISTTACSRSNIILNQRPNYTRNSAIAEGPRDASCQLKSCQLPRNSAETT